MSVSPKAAPHTDHRLLRVVFPLIWASFPFSCRPITALTPPITHFFGWLLDSDRQRSPYDR
jgi:hypothetical protein